MQDDRPTPRGAVIGVGASGGLTAPQHPDRRPPRTTVRRRLGRATRDRRGDALTPPPAVAEVFAGFVENEQRMVLARAKLASADATTREEGDDESNTALFMRHGYARQLGAEVCDGKLPHPQEVAAERSAQPYDLTTSTREACRTLVTRSFLASEWGGQSGASPLAKCGANLRSHLASGPHRNIRVVEVTGVENVSATVSFTEVPDCGCGSVSARLYFDRGRWLVNHVTVGQ